MPQAVPALIIAAGQVVAAGAITWAIVGGFVVNVALSSFEYVDEHGARWVALER